MITFNLIRSDRPVLLISSALFILLQLNSITGWAHGDGEEHKPAPEILINSSGESIATDGTTYLDLGDQIKAGPYSLKRKITRTGKVLYAFSNVLEHHSIIESLNFSADHNSARVRVETIIEPPQFPFQILSPTHQAPVEIDRSKGFEVRWSQSKDQDPDSHIEILIESLSPTSSPGQITGRIKALVADRGTYLIPASALSRLPRGKAQIAVKRVLMSSAPKALTSNDVIQVARVRSQVFEGILR